MTVTHPETRGDEGVVCFGDAHLEGPDGSNSAQDAHGTHLGGGFLLLLQWISARTLYHGLYSALVQALQHQNRIPMGDRGRHQGVFRSCIPHDKLVAEVARRIADPHILKLIRSFLKSGIMDQGKLAPSEEGTPQGGIVSPLLANIYLHRFDEWYYDHYGMPDVRTDAAKRSAWQRARRKGKNKAATQMFRYADDWIIAIRGTRAQAQDIKEECKRFLQEEMGLELSEEKTVITHIIDGFDFLGYHIFRCDRTSDGNIIGVFMQPTEKGLKRVKQKIKDMTEKK